MTKSGFESDTVKNLINIVTITPLVIAGLYSSIIMYDFIFPHSTKESENVVDYLKRTGNTMFSSSASLFFTLFNYISIAFSYIWKFITYFRFSMVIHCFSRIFNSLHSLLSYPFITGLLNLL